MLPDLCRQLLTAYVDGELSGRQRRHVVRLLKRSEDARLLLRRLQQDAAALSNMTSPKLGLDLSASVLHTIRERRLSPIRRKPKPLAPAFPAWVGVAIAASVLCTIGLASYMGFAAFLAHSPGSPSGDPQANNRKPETNPDRLLPSPRDEKKDTTPEVKPEIVRNDTPRPNELVGPPAPEPREDNLPTAIVKAPGESELHGPPEPDPKPLTNPAMERFKPEIVVGAAGPVILKLHDLDKDDPRKQLLVELTQHTGFRLELPCADGTRSFDRLQAACKDQKIALQIDQKAQQRLKTPQSKTNYVLYIENITPDELTRLVQQIGAEDKKAAAKKPADARFVALVVTRLTKRDYKELSDLLGVDPSKVEPTGPLGTDLHKPFSEQTPEQIAKALDAGKGAAKSSELHQALVLAYNPVLPPKNSPEVKKYLDARKPAKTDTVRAIIVLRGT